MPTEDCYRCGKPLKDYFRLLCPECRAALDVPVTHLEKPADRDNWPPSVGEPPRGEEPPMPISGFAIFVIALIVFVIFLLFMASRQCPREISSRSNASAATPTR